MPKIIDHDAHRREIVSKAAALFRSQGFSGLTMRRLAADLGMSKSALYHYFPTKDALFSACADHATQALVTRAEAALAEEGLPDDPTARLARVVAALEVAFQAELRIVLDYVRDKTPQDIAADPVMGLAHARYRQLASLVAGREASDRDLAMLLGLVMLRLFNGGATEAAAVLDG